MNMAIVLWIPWKVRFGVIPSGAAFQAEGGISRSPDLTHKPNCTQLASIVDPLPNIEPTNTTLP
jgi:hypothetical protein